MDQKWKKNLYFRDLCILRLEFSYSNLFVVIIINIIWSNILAELFSLFYVLGRSVIIFFSDRCNLFLRSLLRFSHALCSAISEINIRNYIVLWICSQLFLESHISRLVGVPYDLNLSILFSIDTLWKNLKLVSFIAIWFYIIYRCFILIISSIPELFNIPFCFWFLLLL